MNGPARASPLSPQEQSDLARAIHELEHSNLAARIADYAGEPFTRAMRLLPRVASRRIDAVVERAVIQGLELAIDTLDGMPLSSPARARSTTIAGITGGVGGVFGLIALPIELPFTTTIMLRAIADIARHEGEDLSRLETRLACLEVFALSANGGKTRTDIGYYAARALLSKLTADAAAFVLERGVTSAAAPIINSLISAIVARFGAVVSDRVAASALPLVGALGGATVNVIFMNHFQTVAQAHFTVRRLERLHGVQTVRRHYDRLAIRTARASLPRRQARPARALLLT
jgi:hypothetical protein